LSPPAPPQTGLVSLDLLVTLGGVETTTTSGLVLDFALQPHRMEPPTLAATSFLTFANVAIFHLIPFRQILKAIALASVMKSNGTLLPF